MHSAKRQKPLPVNVEFTVFVLPEHLDNYEKCFEHERQNETLPDGCAALDEYVRHQVTESAFDAALYDQERARRNAAHWTGEADDI